MTHLSKRRQNAWRHSPALAGGIVLASLAGPLRAEGTEGLGPLSNLVAQSGTDVLLAGIGLNTQPSNLELEVPAGQDIRQVIAYWSGTARDEFEQGATDTITIDGIPVTGERIGGPSLFKSPYWVSTYRADITALSLVGPGANSLAFAGLDFGETNDGAGLAVIVDDGSEPAHIELRDGSDFAYYLFKAPYDTTVAQTFAFEPSEVERVAKLGLFFGSVAAQRPTAIEISIDGVLVETLADVIGNLDGPEWDTLVHPVVLPAGASSVTVRPLSLDTGLGQFAGNQPASLTWVMGGLTIEAPAVEDEGCNPCFWLYHFWKWDGWCNDDVTSSIKWWMSFNCIMGTSPSQSGTYNSTFLLKSLWGGSTLKSHRWLNREAAAALANADSLEHFPYTVEEVIALYRDAVGADAGPETLESAREKFACANEQSCPFLW